jgi:tetratricopeptide (TPR) repeat protein
MVLMIIFAFAMQNTPLWTASVMAGEKSEMSAMPASENTFDQSDQLADLESDASSHRGRGIASSPRGMIRAISKSGKGGRYQEILRDVREVLADPSRRGELKYHIARIQLLSGNFKQAAMDLEVFLETSPKGSAAVNALVSLASAYLGLGRHDLAEGVYRKLFREHSPDDLPEGLWYKYMVYRFPHVTSWNRFRNTLKDMLSSADAHELRDNGRALFNSRLDLDIMDSDRCLSFLEDLGKRTSSESLGRQMALCRAMIFNFDVDDYGAAADILEPVANSPGSGPDALRALFVLSFTRGFLQPDRNIPKAVSGFGRIVSQMLGKGDTASVEGETTEAWILPAAAYLHATLLISDKSRAAEAISLLDAVLPRDKIGKILWPEDDESILYGLCALTMAEILEISIGDLDRAEEYFRAVSGAFPKTFLSPRARTAIQRLPKAGRSRDRYLFNVATNYYKQGDIPKALETWGLISRDYPGSPLAGEAILESARILADDLLDSMSSLSLLQKFVDSKPSRAMASRAMFKIANILEYIGEYKRAMAEYDLIAGSDFDPILRRQAMSRKALILDRKYKKYKESAEIYETILQDNQDDRESDISRYNLALLYRDKLKKNDEAEKLFRRILADPTSVFRGRAYSALNPEKAPPPAEASEEEAGGDAALLAMAPSAALQTLIGRTPAGTTEEVSGVTTEEALHQSKNSETLVPSGSTVEVSQLQPSGTSLDAPVSQKAAGVTSESGTAVESAVESAESAESDAMGAIEEALAEDVADVARADEPMIRVRELLAGAAAIGSRAFEETLAGERAAMTEKADWKGLSLLLQEALPFAPDDLARVGLLHELSSILREKLGDATGYEDCLRGMIMLDADRELTARARVGLAGCFLSRGDFAMAAKLYSESTAPGARGRVPAEAMLGLADIAFRYGNDPQGSLESYRQAASMTDDPALVMSSLKGMARASLESGLARQGELFLSLLAESFPDHPEGIQAMLLLSCRRLQAGDRPGAIELASEILSAVGETTEAGPNEWITLAREIQETGKDPFRISRYREFVNKFPTSSELESVYVKMARALLRLGDIDEAAKIYSAMAYMFPRGEYFSESRKFTVLEPRYRELARISDEIEGRLNKGQFRLLEDLRYRRAEILVRDLGKLGLGKLYLSEFIYRYPASIRLAEARKMMDVSRGAASFESVMTYVDRNPDTMESLALLYSMAKIFQKDGLDPERSIELYSEIVRRYPASPLIVRVRENMADINERILRKYDLAAQELEKLVPLCSEGRRRIILTRLARLYSDKMKDRIASRKVMETLASAMEGEEKERQQEAISRSRAEDRIAEIRRNLFSSAGTEEGRELLLSLGEELEKAAIYDLAVVQYGDYVSLFSSHPTASGVQLKIASIQDRNLDKPLDAITSYRNYLRNYDPTEKRDVISFRIAQLLSKALRHSEAVKHLELWLKRYRDSKYIAEAEKLLARSRIESEKAGKTDEGDEQFQRKSRYDNVTADMLDIQVERYASSLTDQEVEVYKKISELQEKVIKDPGDSSAPKLLVEIAGLYSEKAGNFRRALEYLGKVVEYYQDYANASNTDLKAAELADEKLEDFEEALVYYRRFFDRHPSGAKGAFVCFKIAQIYQYRISDYESAREFYEKVFESYPDSEWEDDALYSAAMNYSENLRDYEMAVQIYQRLIDKYYDSDFADDSQYRIGMIYENNLFDFPSARDAYQKVLDNYSASDMYSEAQNGVYRMEEYIQRGM